MLRTLLTTDAVGGVWSYSLALAQGLSELGIEVILVVLGPAPDHNQERVAAAINGVRLLVTDLPLDWLAETAEQVRETADALAALSSQNGAKTVQLHAPALISDAAWPVPVAVVTHSCVGTWWEAVHGGALPPGLAWRAEATATGIRRADCVIAPSHSFAEAVRSYYGITGRIEVVHNGQTPARSHAKRERQVLTAGRLWDEGKNIIVLDSAAALLQWPVFAAGPTSGPNGACIKCQHLRLLGPLDADTLNDAYARSSIFASVALYEPFGLAVLEAAQAGCALVLSDIPTFRELWHDAALFVAPRDPKALALTLEHLLCHPAACRTLGQAAHRRSAYFNVRNMARGIGKIHAKLASLAQAEAYS